MTRPPRRHDHRVRAPEAGELDYLGLEFADFVALCEAVGAAGGLEQRGGSEDFARTLHELPSLVAHILAFYQRRNAADAFLGTASSSASLVRHGRRLAYEPDPGLSALGHVALEIRDGQRGVIAAGFALGSSPRGEIPAQTYETLTDVRVDAAFNDIELVDREIDVSILAGESKLLTSAPLDIIPGEPALLVDTDGNAMAVVLRASAPAIDDRGELELDGTTSAALSNPATLLARPRARLRRFGAGFDPQVYPPNELLGADAYSDVLTDPRFGYEVDKNATGSDEYDPADHYLDQIYDHLAVGDWIAAEFQGVWTPYKITALGTASVTFKRGEGTGSSAIERHVSRTVTWIQLDDVSGAAVVRSAIDWHASFASDWELTRELASKQPSPVGIDMTLTCVGQLDIEPGELLALTSRDPTEANAAEIRRVITVASTPTTTTLRTVSLGGVAPTAGWQVGFTKLQGNVVEVSHGASARAVLGGSDGVSPFLSFTLPDAGISMIPGGLGPTPALRVRVDDVEWTRVESFASSSPEDRHYLLERDHDQLVTVVFGDGRTGAIPPSGKRNITAEYRVGVGSIGDSPALTVDRIKRANPLVRRARNLLDIRDGADPAGPTDVRRQATRYIRTFDRAVSVSDHADLALSYDGVARAAARWAGDRILLVVANSLGQPLGNPQAFREFMDARRDTEVRMALVEDTILEVPLRMQLRIEVEPDYLEDRVRRAVIDALTSDDPDAPGLLSFAGREFGQPVYASEVYEVVVGVAGVGYAELLHFDQLGEPLGAVHDAITVAGTKWLSLRPADLELEFGGAGS